MTREREGRYGRLKDDRKSWRQCGDGRAVCWSKFGQKCEIGQARGPLVRNGARVETALDENIDSFSALSGSRRRTGRENVRSLQVPGHRARWRRVPGNGTVVWQSPQPELARRTRLRLPLSCSWNMSPATLGSSLTCSCGFCDCTCAARSWRNSLANVASSSALSPSRARKPLAATLAASGAATLRWRKSATKPGARDDRGRQRSTFTN